MKTEPNLQPSSCGCNRDTAVINDNIRLPNVLPSHMMSNSKHDGCCNQNVTVTLVKISLVAFGLIGLGIYFVTLCKYIVLLAISITFIISSFIFSLILLFTLSRRTVDPSGRAVLITGCDSGFGWTLAKRLDAHGFQVFAACLNPDSDGSMQLLLQSSSRLHLIQMDVTDAIQVSNAADYLRQNLGVNELWALVNNAGVCTIGEIEYCSMEYYQAVFNVNVLGAVRVTKCFLPFLKHSCGRVVNVTCIFGRNSPPWLSAYSLSESALITFSDCLRREMFKFGVTVVTVEPGMYRSAFFNERILLEINRRAWHDANADLKLTYGEVFYKSYMAHMQDVLQSACVRTDEVVDELYKAVVLLYPGYRYVPSYKTSFKCWLLSRLPTPLRDHHLIRQYSTSRLPNLSQPAPYYS